MALKIYRVTSILLSANHSFLTTWRGGSGMKILTHLFQFRILETHRKCSMAVEKDDSVNWKIECVISEQLEVEEWISKNVVQLLDQGNTIPFIARYRKEQTGGLEVDKIRDISVLKDELKVVQTKISNVVVAVSKLGKLTPSLSCALKSCLTLHEVEDLYAPYKPGHKGTLAERARALNLEPLALKYLNSPGEVNVSAYIKPDKKGLENVKNVVTGVEHIISDIIHKDKEIVDLVRQMSSIKECGIVIETSKAKESKKTKDSTKNDKTTGKPDQSYKYEQYFNYKCPVKYIKSHQVLAINRGEDNKILSVKLVIPEKSKYKFIDFAKRKFTPHHCNGDIRSVIYRSIEETFSRFIQSQIIRNVRSELTKTAVKESIEVFASNLRRLLLTPPLKGKCIFGIDPGFKNGCKTAVITQTGQIIHTELIYLNDHRANVTLEKKKLYDIATKYRCDVFAIGDGVACRESETIISDLIKERNLKMNYCIIDESGVSIYSCTDVAKKDMPDLDPSLRGAVSIARRLLDPMAEFVKVEPKHLGVGQYQHDMPENELKTSLDSVVEECVSFVGVDLNTSSECLLKRIAGLNESRAKKIVEYRETNGLFTNRKQLRLIKGIGEKSFEQCAGFVRICDNHKANKVCDDEEYETTDSGKKRKTKAKSPAKSKKQKTSTDFKPTPLDATWIHPESYPIAEKILKKIGLGAENIGQRDFIEKVTDYSKCTNYSTLASELKTGEPTVKLIIDAFLRPISYDYREGFEKPLFRKGICDINELKVGTVVTGKANNITHFGAFVDIGVGQNGLLHTSQMKGQKVELGNRLEVKVTNVDINRKRIGLELLNVM